MPWQFSRRQKPQHVDLHADLARKFCGCIRSWELYRHQRFLDFHWFLFKEPFRNDQKCKHQLSKKWSCHLPSSAQWNTRPVIKGLLPNGAMTMGSLAFLAGAVDAVCCTKYRCDWSAATACWLRIRWSYCDSIGYTLYYPIYWGWSQLGQSIMVIPINQWYPVFLGRFRFNRDIR